MILLIVFSALVTFGRFFIPGHSLSWAGTYEALAHIWVGFLLAIAIAKPEARKLSISLLVAITTNVILLIVFSALVTFGRFFIPGHSLSWAGTYEALAHIWVGFLLAIAIAKPEARKLSISLLVAITTLETVMFLLRGKA